MAHKLVWRVRDREQLQRQFELYYGGSAHEKVARSAVEQFIEHITHFPLAWPIPNGQPYEDEWHHAAVTVRFRRHPETLLAEVITIRANANS